MSFLAWDHNTYYQPRLLKALPKPCARVLDVGCGKGAFAARLAEVAERVDALDRSPEMIDAAERTVPSNVTCLLGDVREVPLPSEGYDAITSISALHHLPLPQVLPKLAAALRPGGVLVAIAHHRAELPRDLLPEALGVLTSYGRRAILLTVPSARRYRRELDETGMPVKDPDLTLREVRAQVHEVLPAARVRRLLQWRYELLWRKG
ncbi:ubiquinone/menaquinone biosynthesis C-methylase UbiE [Amycolatopsis bartoniae]|uniref:Ubiquinone biosynthesis protein n=1 Tax=Amycolatopsis bartoniae TaxID=941986 RepID=A0A8H9J3C2_9PSEU|nr:class I SAM-dependent methyltransferase [Amycolatopsis bartoniae]MBB2933771.1 ubiquinone/menaquinone biosynthesis C-methylase UbiE [Amycolatopsis bartoniae]TVT10568.1 class I SAM-dependent methyltransferase [Amycolatopsis bartoniae]GHF71846.1 ubiquinone biosynthesis protein [Amycolatopsis bartoniae]